MVKFHSRMGARGGHSAELGEESFSTGAAHKWTCSGRSVVVHGQFVPKGHELAFHKPSWFITSFNSLPVSCSAFVETQT